MRIRFQKILAWILAGVFFYGFVIWLSNFAFIRQIELRHGIEVRGVWYPTHLIPGFFKIEKSEIRWKDHLTVHSLEAIDVHFKFAFFLSGGTALSIAGKNLKVELGKKYADLASEQSMSIDQISLEVELPMSGEPVIKHLEIESPTVQFQLQMR